MDFLTRIFKRVQDKNSADIAKQRLQLMLAQDRTHISPEMLNVLKDEIITVISQHVEIDRTHVQFALTHTSQGEHLIATIPVVGARAPAPPPVEHKRVRRARAARA